MRETNKGPSQLVLADLVDVADLQALQDGFSRLTGIAMSIRDNNGIALTSPA